MRLGVPGSVSIDRVAGVQSEVVNLDCHHSTKGQRIEKLHERLSIFAPPKTPVAPRAGGSPQPDDLASASKFPGTDRFLLAKPSQFPTIHVGGRGQFDAYEELLAHKASVRRVPENRRTDSGASFSAWST